MAKSKQKVLKSPKKLLPIKRFPSSPPSKTGILLASMYQKHLPKKLDPENIFHDRLFFQNYYSITK